jgi:hypothetical protein
MSKDDAPERLSPPTRARESVADQGRMLRQAAREIGGSLLDRPSSERGPGRERLRATIGEMARAADRLIGRTQDRLKAAISPGDVAATPSFQPELMRAVLDRRASAHLDNAFLRQWRGWLLAAFAQSAKERPIVLERPLREALAGLGRAEDGNRAEAVAALLDRIRRAPPVRPSPATPPARIDRVLCATAIAILAASSRQGKAPIEAGRLLASAFALLDDDAVARLSSDAPHGTRAAALAAYASML